MIHVCFGLYDKTGRYSKFTGTTMCSLFESTPPPTLITVHILHDNTLTRDNRDKFSYLAGRYGQHVKFYNVEELCANEIEFFLNLFPKIKSHWASIGCFYRFLIPKIIFKDIEKIIYLDSDLIVNLDIGELWQIELGEHPLAVVPEIFNGTDTKNYFPIVSDGLVNLEDYFNSGVLLIDLNYLREEETLQSGLDFASKNPRYQNFIDQDILNYCFSARALKLPNKFNRFAYRASLENNPVVEKNIYHYVPKPEALGLNMNNPFNRLWIKYFMKTPWFDEDAIGRLYEGVTQMHGGLKSSLINLSAIMSGKTRAFFVTPQDVDMIKKAFSVQKGEDIILAENQDSLKKLIKAMKRSQGKKVFFITMLLFPFNVLINEGFVFGKDFLNGAEFLSGLDSYALIKNM